MHRPAGTRYSTAITRLREFGTGNKEHQQIIEQTEAFLNAYGLSRFAPFPYSPADLPIKELAGYRRRRGTR